LVEVDGAVPDGRDLRGPEVTAAVSPVAALPCVRAFLLGYQRDQVRLARDGGFSGIIMEGRDIGSVVLPDAEVRVFLEADPAVRSARRLAEGMREAVDQRDKADASRAAAPLTCPAGAARIDNTHLTLAEVADRIGALIAAAR
jgi:cytidylate kinase